MQGARRNKDTKGSFNWYLTISEIFIAKNVVGIAQLYLCR